MLRKDAKKGRIEANSHCHVFDLTISELHCDLNIKKRIFA